MPKVANKNIGECPCPLPGCDRVAHIRRQKNHDRGALFINCGTHRQQPSAWLDEYIEKNGRFYADEASPGEGDRAEAGPEPGKELETIEKTETPAGARDGQAPGKGTRGFFSEGNKQFEDFFKG